MDVAQPGCVQFFINLLSAILMGFGAVTSGGGVADAGPRVYAEIGAEGAPTAETLQAVADVLAARLSLLGFADASVVLEAERNLFYLDFPAVGDPSPSVVLDTLIAQGNLELIDMDGADPAALKGLRVQTTSQPTGFLGAVPHPVTGEPFAVVIDGSSVESASARESEFGGWLIEVLFRPEAAERLAAFTGDHIGEAMGIVVDGVLLSAPVIQDQVGEWVVIQGDFSEGEARGLAARLGGGLLPVRLTVVRSGAE